MNRYLDAAEREAAANVKLRARVRKLEAKVRSLRARVARLEER
jgi:hypothetical protein